MTLQTNGCEVMTKEIQCCKPLLARFKCTVTITDEKYSFENIGICSEHDKIIQRQLNSNRFENLLLKNCISWHGSWGKPTRRLVGINAKFKNLPKRWSEKI